MLNKQDLFIMHLEIIRVNRVELFSAGSSAVSVAELSSSIC